MAADNWEERTYNNDRFQAIHYKWQKHSYYKDLLGAKMG